MPNFNISINIKLCSYPECAPKAVLLPHPSTWSPNKHNATAAFISNSEGSHDEIHVLSHATIDLWASPKMLSFWSWTRTILMTMTNRIHSNQWKPFQTRRWIWRQSKKESQTQIRSNTFFDEEEDEHRSVSEWRRWWCSVHVHWLWLRIKECFWMQMQQMCK